MNGRIYGTPAVAGGRVFVPSSTGGSLTAFSTRGGYLWRVHTGSYVYSSPAVWGGRVFFGSYNGVFYGVSAANGRVLWDVGTGGPISGAAVVVDGIAYAGSFAQRIVGVNARTGHVVLNFHHGQYVPVSGDGMRLLAARILEPVRRRARPLAEMKRAAAAAAAFFLMGTPVASARGETSAQLLRRGITHALGQHWLKPSDAARYRRDVNRALWDERRLPPLRGRIIASQLAQLTPLWDSYTSPRALALFTQLEQNLAYFETHRIPDTHVDESDADGVVYRWFPYKGLEFHPLASFSALANAAAAHDVDKTETLADALLERAIPRGRRLIWEYSFSFGAGRPPWASGMAEALAAQSLARAGVLLGDPRLTDAAARAYAAVPPLLLSTYAGPWIRLYGFDREVILNAQLQAIVSLTEYAKITGSESRGGARAAHARGCAGRCSRASTPATGRCTHCAAYHASLGYEQYVTDLLAKLAAQTNDPYWIDAAQRFADYLGPPKVTEGTATADDLSAAAGRVARHGVDPDHAVAACVGDARGRRQGARRIGSAAGRTCSRGRRRRRSRRARTRSSSRR